MTTFEPSPESGLLPMELPLTSSAAGFRARTCQSLERDVASKVRDLVSGLNMPGSFASYDRDGSSWKTSQGCLVSGWETFSETWPRSGTMRRGIASPLPPSAPLTAATGCGSLPIWQTPVSDDCVARTAGKWNSRGEPKLSAQVLFPTPTVKGNHNRKGLSKSSGDGLATFVRMWPTPLSTDGAHGGRVSPRKARNGGNLVEAVSAHLFATPTARDWRSGKASPETMAGNSRPLSEQIGGTLNPTWVEWLMGFPLGWTASNPSATPSSIKSPNSSAAPSRKRKE